MSGGWRAWAEHVHVWCGGGVEHDHVWWVGGWWVEHNHAWWVRGEVGAGHGRTVDMHAMPYTHPSTRQPLCVASPSTHTPPVSTPLVCCALLPGPSSSSGALPLSSTRS